MVSAADTKGITMQKLSTAPFRAAKKTEMATKTKAIEVKVDERLAEAISDKAVNNDETIQETTYDAGDTNAVIQANPADVTVPVTLGK